MTQFACSWRVASARALGVVVMLSAGLLASCGGGAPPAGVDAGPPDSAIPDSSVLRCAAASDCDDGEFCNGPERCAPGEASADPRGCVAGTAACVAGATCNEAENRCISTCADADGDSFDDAACGGNDCDDADPSRHPGATEVCDPAGKDEDCDDTTYGYRDSDADGYPDAHCCNGAHCGTDCDDLRAGVNPAVPEVCNGFDDDCDGEVDEGVLRMFYADADGDGFGTGAPTIGCTGGVGLAPNGTDCDDAVASTNPAAAEACDGVRDDDCDGATDEGCTCTTGALRACGSGVGACTAGEQTCIGGLWAGCSGVGPSLEVCNGVDDNCDGATDEGLTVGGCYVDRDADGYGVGASTTQCADPARVAVGFCPAGYTNRSDLLDCDDTLAAVYPGALEVCNGVDDDCQNGVDDVVGSGDPCTVSLGICARPGVRRCVGVVLACTGTAGPATVESCNGLDDNCNGIIDEGVTAACRADVDGDGFGAGDFVPRCTDYTRLAFGYCPVGSTNNPALDCDDTTASVHPTALEACNSIDDDCDGVVDDGVQLSLYRDADGDTYGTGATLLSCDPVTGYVTTNGDCNDASTSIHPGVPELCDGVVDNNCNGLVDEGCACTNGTTQACGSAVGVCTVGSQLCSLGVWGGCSGRSAGTEVCNALDDDCDGVADEGLTTNFYPDADSDGYGQGVALAACSAPPGYVLNTLDCNDALNTVYPGASELCDGLDNNCNGTIDEACTCVPGATRACGSSVGACTFGTQVCTGTGWTPCTGVAPTAEICNALDDDCNGTTDEFAAALTGLTASCGALSPAFAGATTTYAMSTVASSCRLTPMVTCPGSMTITVNGVVVPSGTASAPIDTPRGVTAMTVAVTNALGATRTYTLTWTRTPSCAPAGVGRSDCGVAPGEDCCASPLVPGGTFYRSYDGVTFTDMSFPASVSDFRLDKYEITVGRFRQFVGAVVAGWRPTAGGGKHSHLNGGAGLANSGPGGGYETGWDSAYTLSTTAAEWDTALACFRSVPTWTPAPGANEQLPQNCLSWYAAMAFCQWDGGFLPSEAELMYAGAGGAEQRVYPWSVPATSTIIDATRAVYRSGLISVIAPVGSKSPGNGRWGQSDLSGNLTEWTLDREMRPYAAGACSDCCYWTRYGPDPIAHGGSFLSDSGWLLNSWRISSVGATSDAGARCARTP